MEKSKMQQKTQKSKTNKEDNLLSKLKDNSLKECLLFLISESMVDVKKINLNGEIEENVKKDIEEAIKDKYKNIEENFSEIRKEGKDLGVLNFKLMIIPLKIKVFLATYEKKDAENVLKRMKEIEGELIKFKK
jgi:hypothetical protein